MTTNQNKMNPRIKKLWLKALRSGKYKQGQGQLKCGDKFCCLGVLCDLHSKETGEEWLGNTYKEASNFPPCEVDQWAGFGCLSAVSDGKNKLPLSIFNDGIDENGRTIKPRTFKQIANYIEKSL